MPTGTDSNSPILRIGTELRVFTSEGIPMLSRGPGVKRLGDSKPVVFRGSSRLPMWIESVWLDPGGKMYAWYHHERLASCPGKNLSVPQIGALVSTDGGLSFTDLGLVIDSWEPDSCGAQNGYFAGGHGDFSVVADPQSQYFYFFFGSYGGGIEGQGVATARMAIADRDHPIGKVWKYYEGLWNEPAIGGRQTPIYRSAVEWQRPDTDSFWGPSVHWNTYLRSYVMLLNRSCCWPEWPQEGVYIAYSKDPANPTSWTTPEKLGNLDRWYPQVFGKSDTLAGKTARFFARGYSEWEIVFHRERPIEAAVPQEVFEVPAGPNQPAEPEPSTETPEP